MKYVLIIYLADIIQGVQWALVLIGIASVLLMLKRSVESNTEYTIFPLDKRMLKLCVLIFLVAVLLPSKKAIYMMSGTVIINDVINSKESIEVRDKVLKLINKKLDEGLR